MVLVQKENLLVVFVVSYKSFVKDDWWESTTARNRIVYQAPKLSIAHFKACLNLIMY